MNKIINITDNNFEEYVISSDKRIVLVDFWAPWCMPCKMQDKIFDKIVDKLPDDVLVAKLNTDENSEKVVEYNINSIPTLLLFKKGKVIERLSGVQNESTLLEKLSSTESKDLN